MFLLLLFMLSLLVVLILLLTVIAYVALNAVAAVASVPGMGRHTYPVLRPARGGGLASGHGGQTGATVIDCTPSFTTWGAKYAPLLRHDNIFTTASVLETLQSSVMSKWLPHSCGNHFAVIELWTKLYLDWRFIVANDETLSRDIALYL